MYIYIYIHTYVYIYTYIYIYIYMHTYINNSIARPRGPSQLKPQHLPYNNITPLIIV